MGQFLIRGKSGETFQNAIFYKGSGVIMASPTGIIQAISSYPISSKIRNDNALLDHQTLRLRQSRQIKYTDIWGYFRQSNPGTIRGISPIHGLSISHSEMRIRRGLSASLSAAYHDNLSGQRGSNGNGPSFNS